MNIDVFTKGLQRAALANRKQRQGKQQDTNAKFSPVLASSTLFDLEAYRTGIIAKAIAHITNNKQRK